MSITKLPKLGKAVSALFRNKASKKVFSEASGLQHPVISKVKPAKNLTDRRKTFQEMTGAVDKQYEKSGLPITTKGTNIKKDAVIKGSKIHDKWDKLVSKRKKNLKETKTLLKGAGVTATAGASAAGVSLYNKKK